MFDILLKHLEWSHYTAPPVSHACAKQYHLGSGSQGELFLPYNALSAWHSHRALNNPKATTQLHLYLTHVHAHSHITQAVAANWAVVLALLALIRKAKPSGTERPKSYYTACAQPYHPGSGSHGQLFRPC